MSSEAACVLVVLGLYLSDCVVLLGRGQALLERAGRRWTLSFGSRHYVIRGKTVALLNPFTPFVPAFKTLPLLAQRSTDSIPPSRAAHALIPLWMPALVQFALVLVVIPCALIWQLGWPLLVGLGLAYLNLLAMLAWAAAALRKAPAERKPLLSLAFTSLVCLPLSANLYRSICLSLPLTADAARFLRLVPDDLRPATRLDLIAHIEEALDEVEEDTPAFESLSSLRRDLGHA